MFTKMLRAATSKTALTVCLLTVVMFFVLHVRYAKQTEAQLRSFREIVNRIFDAANNRIMTTAGLTAQPTRYTEVEVFNRIYDEANNFIRTSGGGGGGGPSAFNDLTSGTNTTATMNVGTGASLGVTGSGVIAATTAQSIAPQSTGCILGTYGHNYLNATLDLDCKQVTFGELAGAAIDAQIPNLSGLSTGLIGGRCVRTNDSTGLFEVAVGDCGTGSGSGVTDGDKTDITVSSSGEVWNIDAGAVGTTELADAGVTLAKMANLAANTFVARDTESTGVPEAVSATDAKAMLGLGNVDNKSSTTLHTETRDESGARNIPRSFVQADTTPITIDATYQLVTIAQLSQNTTFNPPSQSTTVPFNGQLLEIEIFTTLSRTLTFSTAANGFCTIYEAALPTSTNAAAWVKHWFNWNDTADCWGYIGTTAPVVGGGGGAPTDAMYFTARTETGLSAEKNLGALTTGLLKITVSAGEAVPSTAAAGTDYQAPLPNVTNDQQLKRAAGDFNSFASKTTPVGADLLLIEDSADTNNKKKATVSSVRGIGTIHLSPGGYILPSSNPAIIDSSATWLRLTFDNATRECAIWQGDMNGDYASGLTLKSFFNTSATSGSFHLDVKIRAISVGDTGSIELKAWGSNNDCNDALVPATSLQQDRISCALTNDDSIAADDLFQIEICRDVANDDAGAKVALLAPKLEYTK